MAILLTGGVGYIGSHTCVELLRSGEDVIALNSLGNGRTEPLRPVETIATAGVLLQIALPAHAQ